MFTPWGQSDHERKIGEGIVFYGTPSHGGIKVDHEQNKKIHSAIRDEDGWYEEDCEYNKVVFTFPELFPEENIEKSISTLINWQPDEMAIVLNRPIKPEESSEIRQRIFYAENAENYVVLSASGDWKKNVPIGWVEVTAQKAKYRSHDHRDNHSDPDAKHKRFYVRKADYDTRGEFSYVINPDNDLEVSEGYLQRQGT